MASPTARTLEQLRREGYEPGIAERRWPNVLVTVGPVRLLRRRRGEGRRRRRPRRTDHQQHEARQPRQETAWQADAHEVGDAVMQRGGTKSPDVGRGEQPAKGGS